MTAHGLDLALCEDLVARGAAGDARARQQLVEYLCPWWMDMVGSSRSMGPLRKSEDHVRNVLTRLIAKIGREDGRFLVRYGPWRQSYPDKTFADWMRIVAANVVRSYVREQLGMRRVSSDEPSAKQLLNELAFSPALEDIGVRPPVTAAQTARQLLEFARSRLAPDQAKALGLWLEGATCEDIDGQLGLAPGLGRRLVRAAVAVLRRHFGTANDEDEPPA